MFSCLERCCVYRSSEEKEEWISAILHASGNDQTPSQNTLLNRTKSKRFFNEQSDQKGRTSRVYVFAPVWEAKDSAIKCNSCSSKFGLFKLKHHCRYVLLVMQPPFIHVLILLFLTLYYYYFVVPPSARRSCGMVFCDSCSSHRAEINYLNPAPVEACSAVSVASVPTQQPKHRICVECAGIRDDCFLAETEDESNFPIDAKNSALEVKLLSVKGIAVNQSTDEIPPFQFKVLLMFANETKYSNLSNREQDNVDGNIVTWNENFDFRINDSYDDSTELFVELLNGNDSEREEVVQKMTSRKQRLLNNSGYGCASIHLDSLTSARKLQSGVPISLDLPLLGGLGSGGSIKIIVRITNITNVQSDDRMSDLDDSSSTGSRADIIVKDEKANLTEDIFHTLDRDSDIDSVASNGSSKAFADTLTSDLNSGEQQLTDMRDQRALRLTNKAASFKVLAEAAHSLEDNLSKAQEVDAMIRKLQYAIISDQEPDVLTKVESDACVELSRALTGKTTPAPMKCAAESGVENDITLSTTPTQLSTESVKDEGSGSDESSSEDEESSSEEDTSSGDETVGKSEDVKSPFERAGLVRRSPLTLNGNQNERLYHETVESNVGGDSRPSDVVMLGEQIMMSPVKTSKSYKSSTTESVTPHQYAPPKVFIEKTKSYKKISSRLMNPTRASEGSRWDKPISHTPSLSHPADSSQHRDDQPKKSAFRLTSEMYEKKGEKQAAGVGSKTPTLKSHSGNEGFEPSEYNNVSKFQLVQSRLLEPTKAYLESRRGGKVASSTSGGKESSSIIRGKQLSTQQRQSHVSHMHSKSVRPPPRLEPHMIDIENDTSSLREESVTSSLSALTDSDSHVSPLEHPGAASSTSHYAPPHITKHGKTSYNHVQVSKYLFKVVIHVTLLFTFVFTEIHPNRSHLI